MNNKTKEGSRNAMIFISFMLIMIAMGANDSLRGIFAMVFREHFRLNATQVSSIITVSYLGNLVFLFLGGALIDRFQKKRVFICVLFIWMSGILLFILTDNYLVLLVGMFLCVGASTLINTTINILVPVIFTASPGLIVNVLYFVQGIGTSGSQNGIGRLTLGITAWKAVNIGLIVLAAAGLMVLFFQDIPDVKGEKKAVSYKAVMKTPAFLFLTLLFGFYFIAEHGILNWLLLYGTQELTMTTKTAAGYLSVFFGGITAGRLLFAPAVHKLGAAKSIGIFGTIGTIFYAAGILLGGKWVVLLSISGLSISIVYPTLVLMIRSFFKEEGIATATGAIISLATVYDICFNAFFGKLTEWIGLRASFYILPASMLIFCLLYLVFLKTVKPIKNG
ncbi:Fucose permease [Anaerocolumna jejuensis DSM 15929]|uniref:Fucose permease n=1 Tax=Anaerocolumna jejuensis DSM 15929 TaxID=1121322 RepID=A0A1M7CCE5_9FIRM|nr:MFS transporter [Anaerocolumna jejuensis]SHL64945.1 Fucose permease [Anaerocolumna jejuensis DSM 15929]